VVGSLWLVYRASVLKITGTVVYKCFHYKKCIRSTCKLDLTTPPCQLNPDHPLMHDILSIEISFLKRKEDYTGKIQ
jgi:hypothetical protein